MSPTSELQNSLEYLRSDPDIPPVRSREMPTSLSRDVQRHIVKVIQNHPNALDRRAIQKLGHSHRMPHELRDFYAALLDVGIEDDDTIRRLVLWFLEAKVLRIPESVITSDLRPLIASDRMILHLAFAREIYRGQVEDYELAYALENHLCHYGNGRWHLTGLGRTFLRLPTLQATRFLLTLEVFLHAGEWDEWHMSRVFLRSFLQEQEMAHPVHHTQQDGGPRFPDVWNEYLERLQELGLAGRSPDEPDVVKMTGLGKLTVESVLAQDSAFDSLVPLYVREEVIGAEAPDFASEENAERIRRLLEKSPLVGELKKPILNELDRLRQTDAVYLSIFKALAPCIEGLLRNLSSIEHLTVSGSGLSAYIQAIEQAPQPILKPGTLQMVDAVFRPYRNIVEHGHVIAPEPARMLCEISLSVIEQIHQDYTDFKK
jgi:hypothetical protein